MLAMSFLAANFKWIILAVILIAMLIVGYVADKTDFGHKKPSKKEIENPNEVEELDLDNLKGKTLSDMVGAPKENSDVKDVNEDLNAPFGDTLNDDTLYKPINENLNNEDLNTPFGDTSNVNSENSLVSNNDTKEELPVDESLFKPISDINEEALTSVEDVNETNDNALNKEVNSEVDNTNSLLEDAFEPVITNDESIDAPLEEVSKESSEEVSNESLEAEEIMPEVSIETIPETEENISDDKLDKLVEEVEETETEETKRKKDKKKEKKTKSKKESNKYEEKIVPEVITEKFDDNNDVEISTEDDIWKF